MRSGFCETPVRISSNASKVDVLIKFLLYDSYCSKHSENSNGQISIKKDEYPSLYQVQGKDTQVLPLDLSVPVIQNKQF